ncbi:coproporphyrinogen III oxidase [Acetobacteraceae bacterium]|nr:coproporphyrinogen III oxidase [Acetobacteraceae bacterium]
MSNLALYLHWPFCLSKCPYCDFNSHIQRNLSADAMGEALIIELKNTLKRAKLAGYTHISSLFFGGGTPSLMKPSLVEKLISLSLSALPHQEEMPEITLEANPTSSEKEKFKSFHEAGVNRLSLGIQSLNPTDLKTLGREHSVSEALQALEMARSVFDRVSFDLIYARSGQSVSAWEKELKEALSFKPNHLSLYQLTIESGTPYAALYKKKKISLPPDEQGAEMYELTENLLAEHQIFPYEISNYAQKGQESRHNLAYWHYQDYMGVGAGAHGRFRENGKTIASSCLKAPKFWMEHIQEKGNGIEEEFTLTQEEIIEEAILTGLRLCEGISFERFLERTGQNLLENLNQPFLKACIEEGFLTLSDTHLAPTMQGRLRLNAILGGLLGD